VKLLFDENLSAILPGSLADLFPASAHLRDLELSGADDSLIWKYAGTHGFSIVTKDDDFRELSILRGAPPKLIMICLGNCTTAQVEQLLRNSAPSLTAFDADQTAALIELL
jgi:predicted nuclease of predicted toxin-antitoxin system